MEEKASPSTQRSDSRSQEDGSDRICHTVLSYCEGEEREEVGGSGEDVDTQPLSMFSGERGRGEERNEEESRDLDDLFFNLDDPFSVPSAIQCSRYSKLDDTINKLDDPLSQLDDPPSKTDDPVSQLDDPVSQLDDPLSVSEEINSSSEHCNQDTLTGEMESSPVAEESSPVPVAGDEAGRDEQLVPTSPPPAPSQEGAGPEQVPRRAFRGAHSHNSRQYNLHVIPHQFRKNQASATGKKAGGRGRLRSKVNWATRVSVWDMREGAESAGGGGAGEGLGVFEVPLSAEDGGRGRREGELLLQESSRSSNLSLSRLDLSHSSRSRDEQVIPVQLCASHYYGIIASPVLNCMTSFLMSL